MVTYKFTQPILHFLNYSHHPHRFRYHIRNKQVNITVFYWSEIVEKKLSLISGMEINYGNILISNYDASSVERAFLLKKGYWVLLKRPYDNLGELKSTFF